MIAYVGCYTKPKQADPFVTSHGGIPHDESILGQGVLVLDITGDGKMSLRSRTPLLSSIENPSYLTILNGSALTGGDESTPRILGVVSELEDGQVHLYCIHPDDPTKLTPLNSAPIPSGGPYPCHILGNSNHGRLVVSNYGSDASGGSIHVLDLKVGTDRTLSFSTSEVISHGKCGSMADPSRQIASHAHSCEFVGPDGDFFVADLGLDAIVHYSSKMEEKDRLTLKSGSGPRSLTFNPNPDKRHVAAVSLEMAAEVILIRTGSDGRGLEVLGSPYSVLPKDWPSNDDPLSQFNGGRWVSDSAWSRNGELLFVAARLHNSIAVFRLEDDISLSFSSRIETGGTTPRCLTVAGDLLIVAHQHSHDVTSFRIDTVNGTLHLLDKVAIPLAACVKVVGTFN